MPRDTQVIQILFLIIMASELEVVTILFDRFSTKFNRCAISLSFLYHLRVIKEDDRVCIYFTYTLFLWYIMQLGLERL